MNRLKKCKSLIKSSIMGFIALTITLAIMDASMCEALIGAFLLTLFVVAFIITAFGGVKE